MDEQKKEMSAQVQPETAETLQTDEINEQTVQIEQAEAKMAAEQAVEAEQSAQPEKTEPQAEAPEQKAEPEQTELSQAQAELQAVADQTASVQEELPEEPERVTVVDVRFRNNAKTYFFDPGELRPGLGAHVIIETARGDEFGICAGMRHEVKASEIVPPLRKVLRLATAQDERINRDNQEKEKRAFEVCQQKIADHKLDMQLVSAEVAFDGSKILFFFYRRGPRRLPGARQGPCVLVPYAHRAAADRRQRQGEDGGRTWRVRKAVLLQGISGRFPAGLHQDGQDAESEPQPHENFRHVRPAHVLPQI